MYISKTFIGGLLAGVLVVVLFSWISAHPAGPEPGIIHACFNASSGTVQIVGENDTCKEGWSALDWNAIGPEGPQGEQGAVGPQGPPGLADVTEVTGLLAAVNIGNTGSSVAYCPEGKIAIAGGYDFRDDLSIATLFSERNFQVLDNKRNDPTSWIVTAMNVGDDELHVSADGPVLPDPFQHYPIFFQATAICVSLGP